MPMQTAPAARKDTLLQPSLPEYYDSVRSQSQRLCEPLLVEDYGVQSMPDVSPPKWHLAHTTWFFETFVLKAYAPSYREFHPQFHFLFNSYYEAVGPRHSRNERGLLSRPTVEEIYRYRGYVDDHIRELLDNPPRDDELARRIVLGCHHEQQHQELLLTDIKHIFATNPLRPSYRNDFRPAKSRPAQLQWHEFAPGLTAIGHDGIGFCFDCELPRHTTYVAPYRLMNRLVTNGEYLQFIADNGYGRAELWLSDGWRTRQQEGWQAPLYWELQDSEWWHMTLAGMRPVDEHEPVCHVSFYEADAYARWARKSLPTEAAWEAAARNYAVQGNFAHGNAFHPLPAPESTDMSQLYGDVWEWTRSAYAPYPGYYPASGALGEYNGKFMCNQLVLRGGSCATPLGHVRPSYRNFFYPESRWQFSGIRLMEE